eukprot:scaffold256711_cov48-Prasinocladus_malaysianus.AAC.1
MSTPMWRSTAMNLTAKTTTTATIIHMGIIMTMSMGHLRESTSQRQQSALEYTALYTLAAVHSTPRGSRYEHINSEGRYPLLPELVLKWLPVSSNTEAVPVAGDSPIKSVRQRCVVDQQDTLLHVSISMHGNVLRSKGFVWMSNSHATAFYWSHAGQHFEIRDEGDWWAAVDDADWPEDQAQQNVIIGDFDFEGKGGDRRQEIVFIGVKMSE